MLCVLFVAARLRALQLAENEDGSIPAKAGPPVWVQDCMAIATDALFLQIMLVVVLSCLYPIEMDADGNVKPPRGANKCLGTFLTVCRYGAMVGMYGGACGVLYGLFWMKPEVVQPYAFSPLIPGAPIPPPPTPDKVAEAAATAAPVVGSTPVVGSVPAVGSAAAAPAFF